MAEDSLEKIFASVFGKMLALQIQGGNLDEEKTMYECSVIMGAFASSYVSHKKVDALHEAIKHGVIDGRKSMELFKKSAAN